MCGGVQIKKKNTCLCDAWANGGGVRGSSGVGGKPHGPHMAMSRIRKL